MGLVAPRHVGSSQTRARTRVSCIGRQILNHCTTREALLSLFEQNSVLISAGLLCVCAGSLFSHLSLFIWQDIFSGLYHSFIWYLLNSAVCQVRCRTLWSITVSTHGSWIHFFFFLSAESFSCFSFIYWNTLYWCHVFRYCSYSSTWMVSLALIRQYYSQALEPVRKWVIGSNTKIIIHQLLSHTYRGRDQHTAVKVWEHELALYTIRMLMKLAFGVCFLPYEPPFFCYRWTSNLPKYPAPLGQSTSPLVGGGQWADLPSLGC